MDFLESRTVYDEYTEAGTKLSSKLKSLENFTISKIFGAFYWV